MSAKELETLFRCYVAEQVQTQGLLINSESFLTLQTTASSAAHVHVSLLPSDMEYAILDPDCVRKCKFTVKDKTSHLVYPSFNKELATNDNCNVCFRLVYMYIYIYIYLCVCMYVYKYMWTLKLSFST
jgi:hypothetical protein